MSITSSDHAVGRREYDKLQSDYMALSVQMAGLLTEMAAMRAENKAALDAVRAENKELLDIWKTAKGVNSFIVWFSKFVIGAGIIAAFFKWGPIK